MDPSPIFADELSSKSDLPDASTGTGSYIEDLNSLWQGNSIVVPSPSKLDSTDSGETKQHRDPTLPFWMVFMVATGGALDFVAGMLSTILERNGVSGEAPVFLITVFSFVASAVPPSLSSTNWKSLREVNAANPQFKYNVWIPGLADCAITSMRFGAILFVPPAVVSMLKTASQLVLLSIIQHFRGKQLNCKSFLCLVFCMGGLSLVMVSTLLGGNAQGDSSTFAFQVIGLSLSIGSGLIGAVRNVLEEHILQGDDLTAGGLLLTESYISLFALLVMNICWKGFHNELTSFTLEMLKVFSCPPVWALLPLIMGCTYGKDFGKLVVVKRGNALLAKVLTLLFPVVTWVISLTVFFISAGVFGEGFDTSAGWLRLAGFAVVAVASISFVRQKKK